MTTLKLWARFARATGPRATDVLSVVAFAFATAAALLVLGGILAFYERTLADPFDYVAEGTSVLSFVAGALLLPAIWTLSQSAVKLAITRRDARLAVLRLSGATRGTVVGLTLIDTVVQTVLGILLGIGLYLVLVPAITLIPFGGAPFAAGELLLTPSLIALAAAAVLSIASASALSSLAAVSLSPLGVAQRATGSRPHLIRIGLFVLVTAVWLVVMLAGDVSPTALFGDDGLAIFMLVMMAMMGVAIAVVGPLVLWVIAWITASLARKAETLIAARSIMGDPRAAFNAVGPLALGVMAAGLASMATMFSGETGDQMVNDLLMGALLTVGIAGVLGAVFAGVSQSARILDHRDSLLTQHLMGMETRVLVSSTMRGSVIPITTLIGTSVAGTLLLTAPFLAFMNTSLWPLLAWLGTVVAAVALLLLATWISTLLLPAATRVAR